MDFMFYILLLAFFFVTGGFSQDYEYYSEPQDQEIQPFPDLPPVTEEPYEWDILKDGCQWHFSRSRCVLDVFCRGIYNTYEIFQNRPFYYNYNQGCTIISHFNEGYGEVHVKLKDVFTVSNVNMLSSDGHNFFARVATELDLSDNELTFFSLPTMEVLKTLNLSRNSFSEGIFYNDYDLVALSNIDFSYNTISSIKLDTNKYIFKKLKTIDLSHNYIVAIEDGIFGNFPELEELNLSYNFIDAMNMLTFEGVKNLVTLNLKHNRLSELDSSLFRFYKLEKLVLSENKLKSLTISDFEKLGNLKYIDLSSNTISEIDTNTFNKQTVLHSINLRDNMLTYIEKELFANLPKLKNVNLSKNNFRTLPVDIFKGKAISTFSIKQNKLEGALVQGTFEGLTLVTELDLSFQFITSVEDYAFYSLFKVKTLLLNDNNIQTISNLSFKNLRNLETLDLTNNQLTSIDFAKDDLIRLHSLLLKHNRLFQVKSDFFTGLSILQFLDLSQNNITHLETNSFKSLRGLLNLQIADNPISGDLEENTFDGLTSLPNLDVSGSLFTAVKNGSFNGMTHLKELNLSHSKIEELQFNAFSNTGFIEVLDLSYNKLTNFNINTTDLMSLINLILKNNSLTVISSEQFQGLPRLAKILLAYNNIEMIEDGAFAHQMDLRVLDLSFNIKLKFNVTQLENVRNFDGLYLSGIKTNITFEGVHDMTLPHLAMSHAAITNVTNLALSHIKNLDELVLNNNNIVKVEANNFKGIKSLLKLDLSFNKITYIQPGAFKDSSLLILLNISHNYLKAVNYGIFRGLLYLNTVDMSYNEISDLQSERFYEVRSLSVLIADHNRIRTVTADEFFGTSLTTLSIGGNPISCDVLVNLKKSNIPFTITAIELKENSDFENVDGVTCNVDGSAVKKKYDSENNLPNEKFLLDLKDILHNITSQRLVLGNNDTKLFIDISNKIEDGNTKIASKIEDGNNKIANFSDKLLEVNSNSSILLKDNKEEIKNTNLLLDKLIKVMTAANTVRRIEPILVPKENVTTENFVPYINNVKKQIEDTMAAEKINIINEIKEELENNLENKIKQNNDVIDAKINKLIEASQINASKENELHLSATHEAYSANEVSDNKSFNFIFIEVCVGLILVIMIVFILYKFYNSGMFVPSSHTASTRHLSDPLDNSAL